MAAAIGAITIGGLLVVSALKGVSVTDVLAGALRPLNPAGGKREYANEAAAASDGGATAGPARGRNARQLVDELAQIAMAAGGGGVYIVSAYRPGDPLDHGRNDASRAARDLAVKGVDAIKGPPMPELDRAVVAMGAAVGRSYKPGQRIVDTFTFNGMRVQIIWRTPAYGGHMGHIHVGARAI
jgi:hypothetical protein